MSFLGIFCRRPASTTEAPHVRDAFDVRRFMAFWLLGLAPAVACSVSHFAWRPLALIGVACLSGWAIEIPFALIRKKQLSENILVLSVVFVLTLPPTVPLWMAAAGMAFGILVGQELFGGMGKAILHPALLGRLFLQLLFPSALALPEWAAVDMGWDNLLWANLNGVLGEISLVWLAVGILFLMATRVASPHIVFSTLLGCWGWVLAFGISGSALYPAPEQALLSGGFLLGAFFLATDPLTAPVTKTARLLYGFGIGALAMFLSFQTPFREGIFISILIFNLVAKFFDQVIFFLFYRGRA